MSGITGIRFFDGRPWDRELLLRMIRPMAFRGPDGQSVWGRGSVGLGYVHHATTPESVAERQPHLSPDHELALVFDGRLDNRSELLALVKETLSPDSPDGALVLEAYRRLGTALFPKLLGDFAFALWDGRTQQLILARDPASSRSLYYRQEAGVFLFGSEYESILAFPGIRREWNRDYLIARLLELPMGRLAPFRGIERLPPGRYLMVSPEGRTTVHSLWDPVPREIRYRRDGEYAEHFRTLLAESVRCRLRSSSRHVGLTLSGGLDSGSVGCMAIRLIRRGEAPDLSIQPVSYYSTLPEADERSYIEATAAHMGVQPYCLDAEEIQRQALFRRPALHPQQEPGNLLALPVLEEAFRYLAGRGIRVLLCGHYGDQLLTGYPEAVLDFLRTGQWRKSWRYLTIWARLYHTAPVTFLRQLLRGQRAVEPAFRVADTWLAGKAEAGLAHRETNPRRFRSAWRQAAYEAFLSDDIGVMYAHALAYGLDYRWPFKDRRLVEFCLAIPPEQLQKERTTKAILRRAMQGILPDPVRERLTKSGHTGLRLEWLRVHRPYLEELLHSELAGALDFLEMDRVWESLRRASQGSMADLRPCIRLFELLVWMRSLDRARAVAS